MWSTLVLNYMIPALTNSHTARFMGLLPYAEYFSAWHNIKHLLKTAIKALITLLDIALKQHLKWMSYTWENFFLHRWIMHHFYNKIHFLQNFCSSFASLFSLRIITSIYWFWIQSFSQCIDIAFPSLFHKMNGGNTALFKITYYFIYCNMPKWGQQSCLVIC